MFDIQELDTFHTSKEVQVFTEQEALALVEHESDPEKCYQKWKNYYYIARKLFERIHVEPAKAKLESGYQREDQKKIHFIAIDNAVNFAQNILDLYDWLLIDDSKLPLLEYYSVGGVERYQKCENSTNSISVRLGHSTSKFPLAEAQRDALTHAVKMDCGEILAVNGPPGTGKTTFVLSVVASLWIKAALEESDPPIIIAASTNNQAATNVIVAFGKDFEENDTRFSGRWMPDIESYGGFFSAASREGEFVDQFQTRAFYEFLEQSEFLDRAHARFLDMARIAFDDCELHSIESVKSALHERMVGLQNTLIQIEKSWAALTKAEKSCIDALGVEPLRIYRQSKYILESMEQGLKDVIVVQRAWHGFSAKESIWLDLFRWLPPVARRILLLRKNFIENCFRDITKPIVENVDNIDETISVWVEERRQEVGKLKVSHASLTVLIDGWIQAKQKWLSNVLEVVPILSDVPEIDVVDSFLDTRIRFRLFQFAVHYWEARWLIECRDMESNGVTDWAGHNKTGRKSVRPRWRRRMMITPCIVSTLHSLPSHMIYEKYVEKGTDYEPNYLVNEIDLLIVDEAGQVSPEVAAASFALGKKALIIGDVYQIEPVRSLTESIDKGNLIQYGVMTDAEQYCEISMTGGSVIDGSVMRIAQRTSRYHYLKEAESGMYLREHRRCYDEIISFSNALCYKGLLQPKRGEAPTDCLFPPMGYLHIDGRADTLPAGSRYNALEANQVANWLTENREKIETHYHLQDNDYKDKVLEDLVGVITPFRAQQDKIERSCTDNGIKTGKGEGKLIVGTVHALQGAERPIIIFSAVYSRHGDGNFIDMNASMLNVAVSRAKDSFLVFGDMDVISGASRGSPRKLLARYLFSSASNELVFPLDKRPDLLRLSVSPRLINDAEEHDEYIKQLLREAKNQVDMVSPWVSISRIKESGLYQEMVVASQRGVKINLYTDYHFNSTSMNKYVRSKALDFKNTCEQLRSACIDVYVVNGVHSKLIMADNRFINVGSFNWCSAVRRGRYAKMETSVIYSGELSEEISIQVKALKSRLRTAYLVDRKN